MLNGRIGLCFCRTRISVSVHTERRQASTRPAAPRIMAGVQITKPKLFHLEPNL